MTDKKSGTNRRLLAALILGSLLLCTLASTATFIAGRRLARQPEPDTITEYVEVTREVIVSVREETVEEVSVETNAPAATATPEIAAPKPEPEVEPPPDAAVEEAPAAQELPDPDLALLTEVWGILRQQYDGQLPDDAQLLYAAIAGSVEQLGDDYTRFVPPDLAARYREDLQGSFEGIGAFVRENDEGYFEIVRPIDGQPADLAGLKSGDLIVAVDGESIIGMNLDEAISRVRGPRGTEVILTVQREGLEPFDMSIVRARIEIPIVESEMLPDDVAYVRLSSFSSNASEQLRLAIGELLAQNPEGLILDLRDNPGGFLSQALDVSDLFLDSGVILYERNNQGLDQTYEARAGELAETVNLVVLVNAGSASASEIVAGAIQDHGRAILIGETTFGKGSVQQPNVLSDGSELRVTIARWYTPSNTSISGQGITPDIEVETPEDLGTESDLQLQRAVEYILNGR